MHNQSSTFSEKKSDLVLQSLAVAVVGARGYSGTELCRLLLKHPLVNTIYALGTDVAPDMKSLLPELSLSKFLANEGRVPNLVSLRLEDWLVQQVNINSSKNVRAHCIFLATPAEASQELAPKFAKLGMKVIDISGAFRLSEDQYPAWYGFTHEAVTELKLASFGLQPWAQSSRLVESKIIANPGCYATSVLMGLLPLLHPKTRGISELIHADRIVIDAKSGTSGGGKKAAESLLFTEVDGECLPYKIGKHQHHPEICKAVNDLAGIAIDPFFTTSLLSVRRGIIAGIYLELQDGKTEQDVALAFEKAYADYPLVLCGSAQDQGAALRLQLKRVVGSARTHITYSLTGKKLYLFVTIDNLLKGAASQAVENFNALFACPLTTGLLHCEGVQ